jgi:hypothetical protein
VVTGVIDGDGLNLSGVSDRIRDEFVADGPGGGERNVTEPWT